MKRAQTTCICDINSNLATAPSLNETDVRRQADGSKG